MKYYAVLITHLETEMNKEWKDLTDNDFLEMDMKAYKDLINIIKLNAPENISFKHFKTFEAMCDAVEDIL